jgi:hypothetical protein
LGWFNGKLMLFDKKSKKYFHVYPWETAQDLLFVSKGDHYPFDFAPDIPIPIGETSEILEISEYSNGGSINTQN